MTTHALKFAYLKNSGIVGRGRVSPGDSSTADRRDGRNGKGGNGEEVEHDG